MENDFSLTINQFLFQPELLYKTMFKYLIGYSKYEKDYPKFETNA